MIKAAIVGMGWWGGIIHRQLAGSEVIQPVLGVEPADTARKAAEAAGLETTARFEDALERPDTSITRRRSWRLPRPASTSSAKSLSAPRHAKWTPSPKL